jgi:hypothetical protein
MRALSFLALLLLATPAGAISQVGTCGIRDRVEGFAIDSLPVGFREITPISGSGVQLKGVRKNPTSKTLPRPLETIQIYPLRYDYPELLGLGRPQARAFMLSRGAKWSEKLTAKTGFLVLTTTNGDLRTTVVEWGRGFGLSVRSDVSESTDQYVQDLIQRIKTDRVVPLEW